MVKIYLDGADLAAMAASVDDPMLEGFTTNPTLLKQAAITDYAAFGVHYYWLVDPALGSVEIFELERGRFARALAATEGVVASVPGCPGLTLDLDQLWAELARLAGDE